MSSLYQRNAPHGKSIMGAASPIRATPCGGRDRHQGTGFSAQFGYYCPVRSEEGIWQRRQKRQKQRGGRSRAAVMNFATATSDAAAISGDSQTRKMEAAARSWACILRAARAA